MNVWIVLPVKDPEQAKTRLARAVAAPERARVARWLARRTMAVLAARPQAPVVVVTRGAAVAARARRHGFAVLAEAGASHTAAARQGARWAAEQGAEAVLALAADLPILTTADLRALLRRAAPRVALIAPDRLGLGTNAVLAPPDFPFTFGAPSCARHAALARAAGLAVVTFRTPGLAVDLDEPWDLDLLAGRPFAPPSSRDYNGRA